MPAQNNAFMAKVTQNPLLLQPGCEELFTQSLMAAQADERFTNAMGVSTDPKMLQDEFWDDDDDFISWLRPYNVQDGVLTIPVHGVLLNKMSIKFSNWMTGYTYIQKAFERGQEDPEVEMIAFDIDSPGGEVAGNFALVEQIAEARGEKPIVAYANDHAYSAAYSIATAADEIVITRSGGVGSVGVITAHMDMSEALKKRGVKVTFIYAGEHKKDGNPYEALPAAVKDRIQERIDRIYGEFVGLVAANRGMDEEAVRATEALTYDSSDAIEVGFADRVGALEDDLAAFSEAQTENNTMAKTPTNAPAANDEGGFTQEQMDAAVAQATQDGAAAEQKRMNDILGSDEAKTRPVAAQALLEAGMDADTAKATLAKMPEEAKAETPAPKDGEPEPAPAANTPAPTPFAANMSGPEVGAEVEGDAPDADSPQAQSNAMLDALSAATGKARKTA